VLVFGATLALLLQGATSRRGDAPAHPSRARTGAIVAAQLLVGVYGGYFGAAMGIVMLALLAMLPGDLHGRVAVKNLLSACANGVAAAYFIAAGLVDRRAAVIMVPAAVLGGLAGGLASRRASPRAVRAIVVAIGLGVSALLAYRALASGRP
ncbi:MAG TPA: sulfite exporter TauE/SafE family protein, partial [Polyangia bacterium]|nr:sulfite exporter TauE/SafE family protein [Polyangia bacterium]